MTHRLMEVLMAKYTVSIEVEVDDPSSLHHLSSAARAAIEGILTMDFRQDVVLIDATVEETPDWE